jgi:lipoprotein-anchoring transpeptidase ErfK/SrfK
LDIDVAKNPGEILTKHPEVNAPRRRRSVSSGSEMHVKSGYFIAVAAVVLLPACASTSIASTAPAPVRVVPSTTEPAATTTAVVTLPPDTTVPATTVAPTTTVPGPTTTTIPVNQIAVPAADPPIVGVGQRDGDETFRAEMRLLELGFWLDDADGDYNLTTSQAVMAFQKFYGLATDGVLGDETAAALTAVTERPHGRADAGTLVEIDKGLQLLMFVIDGKTEWILNASSGSEVPYEEPDKNTPGEIQKGDSVTRNGLHDVYRERPEGWWEGDLGEIYRPKYFTGGIAVHGSNHVPDYPASHGCVRVSVPAMDWIWETGIMPLETPVWVHEGVPAA